MKHWSGENPDEDDKHGPSKSPSASESDRGPTGKDPKCIASYAKEISLLFLLFSFSASVFILSPYIRMQLDKWFPGKGEGTR